MPPILPASDMSKPSSSARTVRATIFPPLSNSTLDQFPRQVSVPTYDRTSLTPGILHVGVGNFHRAHQANYLHRLHSLGTTQSSSPWGILGASVLPPDDVYNALKRQHHLYTLVEQTSTASSANVIGSHVGFIPPADFPAIANALRDQSTRIVSLTITEGGYFTNAQTGHFDTTHPEIQSDREKLSSAAVPHTVFGLLVHALRHRRENDMRPFTIMSCDNVPHNGDVARAAVVGLACLVDAHLSDWIETNVPFPNSMVDRITPATGPAQHAAIRSQFGISDDAPVFCESFSQWVLEDSFADGRPALEEVGVQFVDDVTPFETMKIRILNGGHAAIAYPAGLLDIEFGHEAMEHPVINRYLQKLECEEIIPVVPPVPGTDLPGYLSQVCERFSNVAIRDTIRRLCFDGSNRQPKFIVPSIRDRIAAGKGVKGLALVSALWCRYCYGVSLSGSAVSPNDPRWTELMSVAHQAKVEPLDWLRQEHIYGSLAGSLEFSTWFSKWLLQIWSEGPLASLESYLEDEQ